MHYFAAVQYTSTATLWPYLERFQTKVLLLRVNKTKISGVKALNLNHFVIFRLKAIKNQVTTKKFLSIFADLPPVI